ncbi:MULTISPECIES: MarR family winged helix-turn-helix transcriptional regulator [unclassified Cryobacterium]|uniref:MarR family winged helix-turn-helix transcriptional regulator n=1 Tax=unclassified Cryobacterium TaxID=2649013 RepID=UPI00106A29D2|nr:MULTISPECIES: MarR family winged helix-turn-helix transcriptional regulator [unclassified Cryobacterium]TFC51886.1 MarR family transcriptional regulator [Cryobacterium sp. TMB3-1-2]TFC68659.1 MarR family transcriptional regulator [Cryobacterium sp. TMB3-15]TFC74632.1 MarR family transcriptional regulator [Cryobacterium sp. TMB3-10]TFC90144.1 MarR family transcriptional regulator [Cryobacterium sp. TMT4-31]TFD44865.1 MarR family transcriptional regulator [Cryobacterium sp. TMB3-12]
MPAALPDILGDLVSVNHRLTRVAARAARGTESPALWRTLSVLLSSGPIRLGDLAERSRVSQPTATKLVGSLVDRGWVERAGDPDDARASLIASTPAGVAALIAWRTELVAALLPYFADLPIDDVGTLERAVAILRDRVEAGERMAAPHRVTPPDRMAAPPRPASEPR